MSSLVNKFSRVETILATAVADDGTFTVGYPTGTTQASFTTGLAASGHVMFVNDNDKWTNADPGISVSFGASLITITNLTGASLAAGSRIALQFDRADGNDVMVLVFPVDLVNITGAGDVVTDFRPGVDGVIENFSFVVNKPVTTGSKLATLNLEIGTTNVTGGTIALTSALATPQGKVIECAAITAANTIGRDDTLSIEAASVTAFSEGTGSLIVRIRRTPSDAY